MIIEYGTNVDTNKITTKFKHTWIEVRQVENSYEIEVDWVAKFVDVDRINWTVYGERNRKMQWENWPRVSSLMYVLTLPLLHSMPNKLTFRYACVTV